MTLNKWEKDFKSFISSLQMPRDDYRGIMEYIDEGVELLKEKQQKERQYPQYVSVRCPRCGLSTSFRMMK